MVGLLNLNNTMIVSIVTFIGLVILVAPVANKTGEAINNILDKTFPNITE